MMTARVSTLKIFLALCLTVMGLMSRGRYSKVVATVLVVEQRKRKVRENQYLSTKVEEYNSIYFEEIAI